MRLDVIEEYVHAGRRIWRTAEGFVVEGAGRPKPLATLALARRVAETTRFGERRARDR